MWSSVPPYVWSFLVLLTGISLGGTFPVLLAPIGDLTRTLIEWVVRLVPLLILVVLAPSIGTLMRKGMVGRFGGAVILWFTATSLLACLLGLVVSATIFRLPLHLTTGTDLTPSLSLMRELGHGRSVPLPMLAVFIALVTGLAATRSDRLFKALDLVQRRIPLVGDTIGYVMLPLMALFGINIGLMFGARAGAAHYLEIILYTLLLCVVWSVLYLVITLSVVRRRPPHILKHYYVPTALFAAATCSSLATMPVNLGNARRIGIRDEVADFVIPVGAIVSAEASALAYMAYGPFIAVYLFGHELSWLNMLFAWPALVLYSMASPGLPAGMGTALWSAALFSSLVGLDESARAAFVATWLALAGGIPDMIRTVANATTDGFAAIIFNAHFDRLFGYPQSAPLQRADAAVPGMG